MDNELRMIMEEVKKVGKNNIKKAEEFGTKFFLGHIEISTGLKELGYSEESPALAEAFAKYVRCDWGDGEEDAEINERAIKSGYGDVMGVYKLNGRTIWIKTDLNENPRTIIMLPEEW